MKNKKHEPVLQVDSFEGDKVTFIVEGCKAKQKRTVKPHQLGEDIRYFMFKNSIYIFNIYSLVVYKIL